MILVKYLQIACLLFAFCLPPLDAAPSHPRMPKKLKVIQNPTEKNLGSKVKRHKDSRGIINVLDNNGNALILEWHKLDEEDLTTVKAQLKLLYSIYVEAKITEKYTDMPSAYKEIQIQQEFQEFETNLENNDFLKRLSESIKAKNPFIVFALNNGNVIGAALFDRYEDFIPKNAVFLDHLAVLPSAQGSGIGKLLIFSSLALAALGVYSGLTQISLVTEGWNKKAQEIYEHLGFICTEKDKQNGRRYTFTLDTV